MVKNRLLTAISLVALITIIMNACGEENREKLSENMTSENAENMNESEQNNLFIIESDSVNGSWTMIDESNSKERWVEINPSFISMDSSGVGQNYTFNIYDQESLQGEVSRISTDLNGVKSISGIIQDDKGGFVFTVNEGRLLGQIRLTDRDIIIQIGFHEQMNEYLMTELNRSDQDALPGSAPMRRGNN